MPERREYPNPPIVEGLVQFNFAEPIAWNVATPGRVFERIRDAYPTDPEGQGLLQAAFNPAPGVGVPADFTLTTQSGQQVVYKDTTSTRLLVLNERSFSLNSLRPYEGWESLAERMAGAIIALSDVLDIPRIREVVVRYINQVPIPRGQPTEKYFTYEIRTVRSGSSYLKNFVQHVESILPDNVTEAAITFGSSQPQTEEIFPLILDILFKRALADSVTIDQAVEVAVELKRLENAEFESVITDDTRGLFQ